MVLSTTATSIGEVRRRENSQEYDVCVFGAIVVTTVTMCRYVVTPWIWNIRDRYKHLPNLIVGLDILPDSSSNRIATLQLCVDRYCLIYQMPERNVPPSLGHFLANPVNVFVGVDIASKLRRLEKDYGIGGNTQYREFKKPQNGQPDVVLSTLEALSKGVFGRILLKPPLTTVKDVRGDVELTPEQVQYATVDPFLVPKIGRFSV